jgi:hypothetical protein
MELITTYRNYVLQRATPTVKMAESQTGSICIFLRTKDTNKIRKRTFNQHRNKGNLYYTVITLLLLNNILQLV